ncbi:MAG: hypothetical protein IJL73_02720 [Lachnospiraceae bacterium]|nr:hypothetical protein [Lachnospiraceae bacterium]
MINRVKAISRGNINEPVPVVLADRDPIRGVILPGRKTTMEVGFRSENHVPMQLRFYAAEPRITCSSPIRQGETGKLVMEIDTVGLQAGDRLEGAIDIVYNGGEMRLRYQLSVGLAASGDNEVLFRRAEEFSRFAEKNPEAAVKLFAWKDFLAMPFMQDLRLRGLYGTFQNDTLPDAGLSEFFAAAGLGYRKETAGTDETKEPVRPIRKITSEKSRSIRRDILVLRAWLHTDKALGSGTWSTELDAENEALMKRYPEDALVLMYGAWVALKMDAPMEAREYLLRVQDEVQKERLQKKEYYCLFLYLANSLENDPERMEDVRKLIHRYWAEGTRTLLMALLQYFSEPKYAADYEEAEAFLRDLYLRGFKNSAVLHLTAELYESIDPGIGILTDYELNTVLYALRHGGLQEKKLFSILGHDLKNPAYLNLYTEVLKEGYRRFGNIELLHAIMNVFLQRGIRKGSAFHWYGEALNRRMTIQGLPEAYLQAAPKDLSGPLSKTVVEYFGLAKENTDLPLDLLYGNVLTEYASDLRIQDLYKEKIEAYALRSMKEERFSTRMKPVYARILNAEYLNADNARYYSELFDLREIRTERPDAKRLVIHYPQLGREDFSDFLEGAAVTPVFSEEAVFAVEDGKGRRFHDASLTVTPVFTDETLRLEASKYTADQPVFRLREADEILRNGIEREKDLVIVTDFTRDKRIVSFYRSRLYESMIDLSLKPGMEHIDCTEFLLEADFSGFDRAYRKKLIRILIDKGYLDLALEKMITYGSEGLPREDTATLVDHAAAMQLMAGNRIILAHCFELFEEEMASQEALRFLAKYYEGASKNMLSLVRALHKRHRPTENLVARTMTELFFVGKTKELEPLFEWYMHENDRDETLVSAYLITKGHEYFMKGRKMGALTVELLKRSSLRENAPKPILFGLLSWYADHLNALSEEDQKDASALLRRLLEQNIILGCYAKLAALPDAPSELKGRIFLEFRREGVKTVSVAGYVMPLRHAFHRALQEVYPGVFTHSFMLYRREWLQYTYILTDADGEVRTEEGEILAKEDDPGSRTGRYEDLSNLERKISEGDDRALSEALSGMLFKEQMEKELFRQ